MPLSGDTLSGVTLLDLASPYNYTLMLPSQISVKYKPNGTDSSKTAYLKNIAWHYYSYGGVADRDATVYCIEPHKNYAAGTPGNYVDEGVDVYGSNSTGSTGSDVWYSMPTSYRKAIAYILQYSEMRWDHSVSATAVSKNNNPNYPLRMATQVLIYEIVMGLRDADSFVLNSDNGYVDGSILYDAFSDQVSGFSDSYYALVSDVQNAELRPSFTSSSSSSAPTITLEDYLTWVNDSNGVLSNYTFPEDGEVYFNVYGNDMCIENYGEITGTRAYTCYRTRPSIGSATFNVFYPSTTTYQTCVNLLSPATTYTYAYFKVYAAASTGDLSLTKTTSDGKNLSGWQFSIYSNSACTSLVAGPYTTNSNGKISVSGLSAGTYYVKEIGHQTASINSQYSCTSTNPQKVTITAGSTASVSFTNTLKPGSLSIKKTTSDGKNLSGWQFSIYSNSACTTLVSGPHTCSNSGAISVSNLTPGTYYVKEVGHTDSSIAAQYTCSSTNPQKVTITAGGTASVSFANTLKPSGLDLTKTTEDGKHLEGWQFSIYSDEACTQLLSGPHTTDANGKLSVTNLSAGIVYVKEVGHEDSAIAALYTCASTNPQKVTITNGQTAAVSFLNDFSLGCIKLVKTTNIGTNLEGWKIGIYTDAECTNPISGSPFTTGTGGIVTVESLLPGKYYAKEEGSSDPAWECDTEVKTVTVAANQTASVTFTNRLRSGEIHIHKKDQEGSPLAGAEFLLEWSEDGTAWEPVFYSETLQKGGCSSPDVTDGKLTSLEDGLISYTGLWPTLQYRLTETAAPEGYQLLADCAYEGELPIEQNLILEVTVVNMHTFEIPKTGAKSMILMPLSALLCLGVCATLLIRRRRR